MNAFELFGGVIAVPCYALLISQIRKGDAKQNFITLLLYTVLDCIACGTIICQHGAAFLPFAYALGTAVVAIAVFKKNRRITWEPFDVVIVVLAAFCLIAWSVKPRWGTIMSIVAATIAACPQFRDYRREPETGPFLATAGFELSAIVTVIGTERWAVEHCAYPVACVGISFVSMILISRKFFLKPKPARACANERSTS